MTNIETLLDGVVAALQDIPTLVALLDGEPGNVFAYKDGAPVFVNLQRAIFGLTAPKVMIAYGGFREGRPGESVWLHPVDAYVQAGSAGVFNVLQEITDGIKTSTGIKFRYSDFSAGSLYTPMEMRGDRITNQEGFDFWIVRMIFSERSERGGWQ